MLREEKQLAVTIQVFAIHFQRNFLRKRYRLREGAAGGRRLREGAAGDLLLVLEQLAVDICLETSHNCAFY